MIAVPAGKVTPVDAAVAAEPHTDDLRSATASGVCAAGCTDRGTVRPTNQDCFCVDPEIGLLLVADGMGGHAGGDVASRLAAATVAACLKDADVPAADRLRDAFALAHRRLQEASRDNDALARMGTTLVAALEQGDRLVVAWAGDSRLYVLDREGLHQVTRDDSWLQLALEECPDASAEELARLGRHPLRNALTNAVGSGASPEVHVAEWPILPGMTVVMTTDGVHGVLAPGRLAALLAAPASPAEAATRLVSTALDAGSTDNCTAVVARFPD